MKADNELAVNLPVLFKSVKKWICKKTLNETKKTKAKWPQKKSKKKMFGGGLNPTPLTCKVIAISIVPRHQVLNICVKLIIFNIFAHEILQVDAVWT